MDSVTLIKNLCKEKGIAISKLEKDCGFSNGYIRGLRRGVLPNDRAQIIAEYLGISIEFLTTGEEKPKIDYMVIRTNEETGEEYYLNIETAQTAQKIFEEDRVLFDVYRSTDKDRLVAYAKKLKALRDMEEGEE